MKRKWIGACVVLAAAVGLVMCKQTGSSAAPSANTAPSAAAPSVILIANMGEADEPCGCGGIIRAVRVAAARGVVTKEIDTHTNKEEAKKYNARVVPTVILLDTSGNELRRHQGESDETIKALKQDLDGLPAKK